MSLLTQVGGEPRSCLFGGGEQELPHAGAALRLCPDEHLPDLRAARGVEHVVPGTSRPGREVVENEALAARVEGLQLCVRLHVVAGAAVEVSDYALPLSSSMSAKMLSMTVAPPLMARTITWR